jgi:hypothetical protein
MLDKVYETAAAHIYVRLSALLTTKDELSKQLVREAEPFINGALDGAEVAEIGAGDGSLAHTLLTMHPAIKRYVAYEPSAAMRSYIKKDRRLVISGAEDSWHTSMKRQHCIVSRYVFHDLPEELESSYLFIRTSLDRGGCFMHLDAAHIGSEEQSHRNARELIEIVENLEVLPAEQEAKVALIKHLRDEVTNFLPLERHLELLRNAHLHVEVLSTQGNSYLLRATRG